MPASFLSLTSAIRACSSPFQCRELDRQRGGSSADSVVVVLAGEAGGIASLLRSPLGAALGIAASADGTPCRQYIQLNGFAPGDMLLLLGSMADSRGFHLERGLLDDEAVRSQMEEICRCAAGPVPSDPNNGVRLATVLGVQSCTSRSTIHNTARYAT